MTTNEIRTRFLKFFEARGHKVVASDSLVPAKDPSILFTGAGMNQFKEQFMGRNVTFKRAATAQKCLRTADLENVGRTASHHTFFEMLGNFSFGDYFKPEAIAWAWEFFTKDLKIPETKLLVSVYKEDEEAYNIWLKDIKVPASRILKLGDKDNFWPSEARKNGPNGPCGPCSEIFYDRGEGEPVEVWNLVFTQFERKEGGVLTDLPTKNIDTGMGLERIASVMQGVKTNFEIDIFIPIIQAIKRELRIEPKTENPGSNISAIADHIRAVTFAICDGVYPSNEERGFVIRKLIRKSTERAERLKPGAGPFLYRVVPSVVKAMKEPYPELEAKREIISQIVKSEEERFQVIILDVVPVLKEEFGSIKAGGAKVVPGEIIFRYSDEKGVPFDFQKEIAQELGLGLDTDGFDRLMAEQKNRARAKSKISKEIFAAPAGLAKKADRDWSDEEKLKIRANHTATHLLHAALRSVLGEHVWQSGSLVYPDRLRFDFSHPKKVEKAEVEKVEELVNREIAAGHEVKREVMKLSEAKRSGAIALFGEKYEDEVVVRSIGGFSKELCGGDHIDNTKNIKIFKIMQEASIAAGTRRIEAITGDEVYDWLAGQVEKFKALVKGAKDAEHKISEIDGWLKTRARSNLTYTDLKKWYTFESQLMGIIDDINAAKKKTAKAEAKQAEEAGSELIDELIKGAREIKGIKVAARLEKNMSPVILRKIGDKIIEKFPASVVLLASAGEDKANLILAVGKDAVKKGLSAQELIKPLAAAITGSGGGRPEFAQAGAKDASKIKEALEMIYKLVEEKL